MAAENVFLWFVVSVFSAIRSEYLDILGTEVNIAKPIRDPTGKEIHCKGGLGERRPGTPCETHKQAL